MDKIRYEGIELEVIEFDVEDVVGSSCTQDDSTPPVPPEG